MCSAKTLSLAKLEAIGQMSSNKLVIVTEFPEILAMLSESLEVEPDLVYVMRPDISMI